MLGGTDPDQELGFWQRPGDAEALCNVTPDLEEMCRDLCTFNTLRDDLEAEVVAQQNGGGHDGLILRVEEQVADEAAIDLELCDGEPA